MDAPIVRLSPSSGFLYEEGKYNTFYSFKQAKVEAYEDLAHPRCSLHRGLREIDQVAVVGGTA